MNQWIGKKRVHVFLGIVYLAFVVSIPLSQFLSARLLVFTFLLVLVFYSSSSLRRVWIFAWDIVLYAIILISGLVYSDNFVRGLSFIETSFPLIALPFILSRLDKTIILQKVLLLFVFGLFFACFLCLVHASVRYIDSGNLNVFFFDSLLELLELDSTYFSYYLIFALTFGFHLLYFNEVKMRIGLFLLIIFFYKMLVLTAGTIAYVSFLLVLSFFILKFISEHASKNHKKLIFGTAIFFLFFLFFSSYLRPNQVEENNYWERFILWEAAIKATPNLFIGVGTGDYTSVLNDYYRSHDLSQFSLSNYNAHNQFIQTILSNGFLGLIALLIMMIRPLILSIRHQNPLGILVFFSFFIYGLTEVFLGRYQGVVFFALMHQSFITYYYRQSKVLAVKES
jgi:O-antigen ligase